MAIAAPIRTERLRIVLRGAVQGVGFRPTVYRLAQKLRLAGWVRNSNAGLEIEVEGGPQLLDLFVQTLKTERPRVAIVTEEEICRIAPPPVVRGSRSFLAKKSCRRPRTAGNKLRPCFPISPLARNASRENIRNFSMLVSHVLVPPAMEGILSSPECRVQGFLAAGHVCMVVGLEEYFPISQKYRVPIVVAGFEPLDLLEGVHMAVVQLESGRAEVENQYARAVRRAGNLPAQERVAEVFEVTHRAWRGIGEIPSSGLRLRLPYRGFDAEIRFEVPSGHAEESRECIAGLVLQGLRKPYECPAFATRCTPDSPLGAPMVSSEGVCAAYFHFGRRKEEHGDSLVSIATAGD